MARSEGEWVRQQRNPNDDLDTGYVNKTYEARLEALPLHILRQIAMGEIEIDDAEALASIEQ